MVSVIIFAKKTIVHFQEIIPQTVSWSHQRTVKKGEKTVVHPAELWWGRCGGEHERHPEW